MKHPLAGVPALFLPAQQISEVSTVSRTAPPAQPTLCIRASLAPFGLVIPGERTRGAKHPEDWSGNSLCEHASLQQRAAYSTHAFFSVLGLPKTQLWLFLSLPLSTGLALAFLYFPGAIKVTNLSDPGEMGSNPTLPRPWVTARLVRLADLPLLRSIFQAFHNGVFNTVSERCRKVSPDPERSLDGFSRWAM